jgi:hypothetical protein
MLEKEVEKREVRVLVVREGEWWVMVCLEHFIATQVKAAEVKDPSQLEDAFAQAFVTQFMRALELGIQPFANLPPAPKKYIDAYEAIGRTNRESRLNINDRAPVPLNPPYVARFLTTAA